LQEDIEIDHLQADEQKRHDDVQQGMIKQVDDLVEYFNSLYQDDQQGIRWATALGIMPMTSLCCSCSRIWPLCSVRVLMHRTWLLPTAEHL
jgi:hypothetical protein